MLSEYNEKLKTDKEFLADHMADISINLKHPYIYDGHGRFTKR